MNKSIYNISLDLHEAVAAQRVFLKRGDTARELHITLCENGRPYEITSDCTAYLNGVLPTGTSQEAQMVRDGNTLRLGLNSAWTTTAGEIVCEVRVYSGSSLLLISPTFSICVGAEYSASVTIDQTLPLSTPADAGKILIVTDEGLWDKGDDLNELKDDVSALVNDQYIFTSKSVTSNLTKREMQSDGTYIVNNSMTTKRYEVTAGQEFKVESDFKFQFQSDNTIPTDGTTTRVGETYGVGTFIVKAPAGSTYLIVCTNLSGGEAAVYDVQRKIDIEPATADNNERCLAVKNGRYNFGENTVALDGSVDLLATEMMTFSAVSADANTMKRLLGWDGIYSSNNTYYVKKYAVNVGDLFKIVSDVKWQFQSDDTVPTSGSTTRIGGTHGVGTFYVKVPEGATHIMVNTLTTGGTGAVYSVSASVKDEVAATATSVGLITEEVLGGKAVSVTSNTIKRLLGTNGSYTSNNNYYVRKFAVSPGETYKIVSDVRWQFQTDDSVPTDGTTTRVGETHGAGTVLAKVPETATYLMVCTLMDGGTGAVYTVAPKSGDADVARINRLKHRSTYYTTPRSADAPAEYFVGVGREYATINDALDDWAADDYPVAVVYIANGEYNEVVYVEDHTISFIGESREGTVIRTTTGAYNDAPFRIHHGNVFIANLTAIADHSSTPSMVLDDDTLYGYAFHIDGGSVGGIVHVKNCTAISYQAPAFGMGTIPGSTIRLEDVEAYCYTPASATKTKNNDCILCHLSSPTTYPDQEGDETLELINVDAYTKETPQVILFKASGNEKKLGLLAINTTLAKGYSTGGIVQGIAVADKNPMSIGNSDETLNY